MLLRINICNVYIVWQPCHFDSTTPTVEDALFHRRISIYKQKDGAFQNSTLSGSNCDESLQNAVNLDHSYCLSTNLNFTRKLENIHSRSYGTSEESDASHDPTSSTDSSGIDLSSVDLSSTDSNCSTDSSSTNSSGTDSSDTDSSSTDSSGTDSGGTGSSSTGSSSTDSSSAVSSSDIDSNIKNEPTCDIDSNIKNEPASDIDSNIKNEPASDIDSNIKIEPASDIDSNIKNEPASDIDLNIKNEPAGDIDSNIKNEPTSDSSQNALEDSQVTSSCKHIPEIHTCKLNSVETVEFVIKIARKIKSKGGTLCGSDIVQTIEKIRPRCVCIGRAPTQAVDKESEAIHYAENYNKSYELLCSLIQRIFAELYSTVRIEENAKEDLSHEIIKHLLLILSYAMKISKSQNHGELTVRDFGEALKFGGFSVLWD